MLLQLDRDQAKGQRRAVDGNRVVRVELHEEIRQTADVVLVPVGEDDAQQPVEVLGDVTVIADDEVDAVQLVSGNLTPASTRMRSSPNSIRVEFLPTSPTPPSGLTRTRASIADVVRVVRRL